MDFTQLRYFQSVAKTGNVTKASETLNVTQPNVSRGIARLEEEIGVPLFSHRKGKIALNDYGRALLSSVEAAFSELATGVQTVQRLHAARQGTLTLACSIDDFLPDLLQRFSLERPEIGIRQFSHPYRTLVDRLLDRSLDIAITGETFEDRRIVYELLGEKDYAIILPEGHALSGESPIRLEKLKDEKFVCDRTRLDPDTLGRVCEEHGFTPEIAFEVESTELVFRLVEGGAGIACVPVPQYVKMRSLHEDSRITVHGIGDDFPPSRIGVAYHKGYVLPESAELFIAFMKSWLAEEEHAIHAHKL